MKTTSRSGESTTTRNDPKAPPKGGSEDNNPVAPQELFRIDVFSQGRRIEDGQSFSIVDHELGELSQGDLTARVSYLGAQPPKGPATLEWSIDGIPHDQRPVKLNQTVEYGNEPTVGNYTVTLKVGKVAKKFNFRISP